MVRFLVFVGLVCMVSTGNWAWVPWGVVVMHCSVLAQLPLGRAGLLQMISGAHAALTIKWTLELGEDGSPGTEAVTPAQRLLVMMTASGFGTAAVSAFLFWCTLQPHPNRGGARRRWLRWLVLALYLKVAVWPTWRPAMAAASPGVVGVKAGHMTLHVAGLALQHVLSVHSLLVPAGVT